MPVNTISALIEHTQKLFFNESWVEIFVWKGYILASFIGVMVLCLVFDMAFGHYKKMS
jgi:hypothetical protein